MEIGRSRAYEGSFQLDSAAIVDNWGKSFIVGVGDEGNGVGAGRVLRESPPSDLVAFSALLWLGGLIRVWQFASHLPSNNIAANAHHILLHTSLRLLYTKYLSTACFTAVHKRSLAT